jgi:hypothetical protein
MARSTYVYIVMDTRKTPPVAAFTVKREMKAWLNTTGRTEEFTRVYRYRDNPYDESDATLMDHGELYD